MKDKNGTIRRTYDELDRVRTYTDCKNNTITKEHTEFQEYVEWDDYIKGKYGEDNVRWNFNSIEDIIKDPIRLKGYIVDELEKVLGSEWTRDVYGSAGGGWKFLKGGMSIFYHLGGGSYYGISTATTGKIKVVNPHTYISLPGDKATIICEKGDELNAFNRKTL